MANGVSYFDETHEAFRASARAFIAREILPHLDEWEDAEIFPRELYKKAAEAGFIGLGESEEYGGTPCDAFHKIALTEEFCRPGSIGQSAEPSEVYKGKGMPGRMGAAKRTQVNLEVVDVVPEKNLLVVRGAVPGANGGLVVVRASVKGAK